MPAAGRALRADNLKALRMIFGIARAYGLRTFIQHYVGHMPEKPAELIGAKATGLEQTRMANIAHPLVEDYSRYIYRRTFEILPELSGLYFNFESSNNAADFVRDCAYAAFRGMKRRPDIVYRLWDFAVLPEMVKLVKLYWRWGGRVTLGHKVMDRSDAY